MSVPRCLSVLCLAVAVAAGSRAYGEEFNAAELARVRYELSKVEHRVKMGGGQPVELTSSDREAFRKVQDLAKRFPGEVRVQELVASAKELYRQAKGERFTVTTDMLAFRERGAKIASTMAAKAQAAWRALLAAAADELLSEAFPVPMPPDTEPADVEDRLVVLEDVPYEEALFVQSGHNWVPVGQPSSGHYWLRAHGPRFASLWEAMRRYRASVREVIPTRWTFLGRVAGPDMLAPGGTEEAPGEPVFGMVVDLEAIYVPDATLVVLDPDAQDGARFVGEEALSALQTFTVTSVPADVQPVDLVRIYITALKERNWDLHLACLDPGLHRSEVQANNLRYTWELQQRGLEQAYAHGEPEQVGEIEVVSGRVDDDLEDFFGEGAPPGTPLRKEERARVEVRLYDERGVQVVRPRYVTLVRTGGGRWYIGAGGTLFF